MNYVSSKWTADSQNPVFLAQTAVSFNFFSSFICRELPFSRKTQSCWGINTGINEVLCMLPFHTIIMIMPGISGINLKSDFLLVMSLH